MKVCLGDCMIRIRRLHEVGSEYILDYLQVIKT